MHRTRLPYFNTQMGKGTVAGGSNLYMGTAALSERDYVHRAIDRADLIIAIGHDTIEKPPFIMGEGGPQVIHVGYTPANVEEVYFPHAEVVGDVGPSLTLLADRLEGKLQPGQSDLLGLRAGILERITDRAEEDRFPVTPQRLVHDVRAVMPRTGSCASTQELAGGEGGRELDVAHGGAGTPELALEGIEIPVPGGDGPCLLGREPAAAAVRRARVRELRVRGLRRGPYGSRPSRARGPGRVPGPRAGPGLLPGVAGAPVVAVRPEVVVVRVGTPGVVIRPDVVAERRPGARLGCGHAAPPRRR